VPLNSIQQHCLTVIDGLQIPGSPDTLTASIQPPNFDDLDGPRAFIWGGRMRGERQTAPRGEAPRAGFKRLNWSVDVWLSYLTTPDADDVDQAFPLIIDAVMSAFWATTMPTFITDPVTGLVSQLLQIGEEFELEAPTARATQTQRLLYYTALLSLDVYEAVQA
jgi:hypothetical protein